MAMGNVMGQFVHQSQKLLLKRQTAAQYDAPRLDLSEHPGTERVAHHGHTAGCGEAFKAPQVNLQFPGSNAVH
jgi:hypothetical protein